VRRLLLIGAILASWPTGEALLREPQYIIAAAAGALGALIGVWISLSASAVVLTLLPLLFGLIGGAAGAQIFRYDPASTKSRTRLMLTGTGALSFSIFCLAGMILTLLARPWIIGHTTSKVEHVNILNLDDKSPFHDKPFDALLLRARLEAVGASEEEIKAILSIAPRETGIVHTADGGVEYRKSWNDQIDDYLKVMSHGEVPVTGLDHAIGKNNYFK